MMLERGLEVDHTTLYRWVQHYAPEMEKRLRWYCLINPVRGFKSMKTAYATLKGFELMRMFKKGQLDMWKYGQGLTGEIRLIERQFGIYRT
jgi:transposase-like protein